MAGKLTVGLVYEISNNPHFGATPAERDSLLSEYIQPSEVNRVARSIKSLGHQLEILDGVDGLAKSTHRSLDIVFNKSQGGTGLEKKSPVPAMCRHLGVPITGSSEYALTLCRHKYHANRILTAIPEAPYKVPHSLLVPYVQAHPFSLPEFTHPVIVKPNHESNSLGVLGPEISQSRIREHISDLHDRYHQDVVVEEFVAGREFEVAILGSRPETMMIGAVEVQRSGKPLESTIQTREESMNLELEFAEVVDPNIRQELANAATLIHDTLNCRDYSRVDFRLSQDGKLYFLEATPQPGLQEASTYPVAGRQTFHSYDEVIGSIINTAYERSRSAITAQSLQNSLSMNK